MKSVNPRAIKESFALIESRLDDATAYFYGRLFAENPRFRALFPPAMDVQGERLFRALRQIVWSIDSPDALETYLSQLGRDHRKFGVSPDHYAAMGRTLLATLRKFAGEAWTAEMERAWFTAYNLVSEMMIAAAEEQAAELPPWWVGEVVEHERRSADLAMLTIRTDQPFPYRAGQYTTIQTAHWPWVWRPYSIAGAPRDDGLLTFHVRAQPGGWVGGALVRRTTAGDVLLLGHPLGTMTLEEDAGRDMLCVAGGTGLAPIKALVQEALRTRDRPRIRLYFGARTEADLYDLPELRALAASCPSLRVIPVVSADPSYDGLRGELPDILKEIADPSGHDAYVAGPPEMVRRTVGRLQEAGLPASQVHHDPFDL